MWQKKSCRKQNSEDSKPKYEEQWSTETQLKVKAKKDSWKKYVSTKGAFYEICKECMYTYVCFIDLKKAFDQIRREGIWKTLKKRGIERKIIERIKAMFKENIVVVRTNNEESREFEQILE